MPINSVNDVIFCLLLLASRLAETTAVAVSDVTPGGEVEFVDHLVTAANRSPLNSAASELLLTVDKVLHSFLLQYSAKVVNIQSQEPVLNDISRNPHLT